MHLLWFVFVFVFVFVFFYSHFFFYLFPFPKVPHVEKHPRFREFLAMIKSGPLREKFESVQRERSEGGGLGSSLNDSMDYTPY